MIKFFVLWSRPADEAGFEAHYLTTHMQLARKLSGVLSFESGKAEKGDTFRVAQIAFSDPDAMRAALTSEAGAAVAADAEFLQKKFGVTATTTIIAIDP